jgi:GT2 family glycosyltransferase
VTPAASVAVVTYNGARYVRRLLDSLRAQTERSFEVVLVDNASTDGTADIVAADYPEVRLFRQVENLHFARGNNLGYREAAAPVVVLLNQDTWVEHDWLQRLLAPLWSDAGESIACTHSPILNEGEAYAHSTAKFRPAGTKLATLSVAGRNCATDVPFDPEAVFYGSGGAVAVRRSQAGDDLFFPEFRAYAEDVALGWRMRLRGGRIVMVPEAHVHHALPSEGRPSSPELVYLWERNRLACIYIHYDPRTRWLLKPVLAADLLALWLPKPAAVQPDGAPRSGASAPEPPSPEVRRELRRAVGRALVETLANNRALRARFAEVKAVRKVPDAEVTRFMTARLTPFDGGALGRLNRFAAAWCRAFGIPTVESARRGEE